MRKFTKLLFSSLLFIAVTTNSKAQTTLAAGDIAFTGYISNDVVDDRFSFTLLVPVTANTVIKFTDFGWRTDIAAFANRSGINPESELTLTLGSAYPAGTEIMINSNNSAYPAAALATVVGGGSAGTVVTSVGAQFSNSANFSLPTSGDQIFAYQGTFAVPVFITGMHMNVYIAGDPTGCITDAANWDGLVTGGASLENGNSSGKPAVLVTGTNCIWIGTTGNSGSEQDNGVFNCASAPITTAVQVRAACNNQANWSTNSVSPSGFTVPVGCNFIGYLSSPPSFTTHPSSATICENAGNTFTIVATGAASYQWQVDQGGGFNNIVNNATYSGATTPSLVLVNVPASFNGYIYRCVATNGSGSTNSNPATLTVTALPVNPTLLAKTPNTATVADGTPVSATFNAGSGGSGGCVDDYRYTTNGGASYLPYTPGSNISTTGLAAGSGAVTIEGRRAGCATCSNNYVGLATWIVTPLPAGATTLNAGDIAFSGYNSDSPTDEFSFVLLRNIGPGTVINFTDNGYQAGALTAAEQTITWTSNAAYAAGTEIYINGLTATLAIGGSAGTVTGTALSLITGGDQILAYRGTAAAPTFISGIHMNAFSIAGGDAVNTTAGAWDGAATGTSASALPPGLTTGTNAIWIGSVNASSPFSTEWDNAKYGNCSGPGVLGPINTLRSILNNPANWVVDDINPVVLPTGCPYMGSGAPPSITAHPSPATICEGTNTSFSITATGALSYQWQVDNGGGFANVTNDATYSGATTNTLNITAAPLSLNGYIYRCIASNPNGSATSNNATLTVNALPVSPTLLAKTPTGISVPDGTPVSATFNAGSGGTGCSDDFRYTTDGGATYLPYTPGSNISTTGIAAGSGFVFIEGRRANCSAGCQGAYKVLAFWRVTPLPVAATTLNAGDIAFSAYASTSTPDAFSFVLLRNIGPGTVINFTDNGWLSTNVLQTGETTVTWTAPAGGLPGGTEITIAGLTATRSGGGAAGTVTGTALSLITGGDQILAYRGTAAAPTFISAIHMNSYSTLGGDPVTTTTAAWDGTANTPSSSALPTGLTNGVNCLWIGSVSAITPFSTEYDNAKYGTCTSPAINGSLVALRAALNNQANWTTDNSTPPSFTQPTGCNYLGALSPDVSVTGTPLAAFNSCTGTPSAEQNFSVSGSNLTTNIVITAPAGFEISLTSGSGFTGSLSLTPASGIVNATTIYVRLSASASGTPSGNITVATTGVATINIPVSGTVGAAPTTANAGPDASVCSLTATLAGNTPTVGTGTWTQTAGPGTSTFTNANSPTSDVTVSVQGVYTFTWTISSGGCTPSADDVLITLAGIPTLANAGADRGLCLPSSALNMAGNTPTVGTGTWTQISGPVAATITNANNPVTSVTGMNTAGTYTFVWTIANAPCPASTDTMNVIVASVPAAFSIVGATTCQGNTVTLTGPTVANVTYTWQRSLSGITNSYTNFGGTTQTQQVTTSGNYQLVITNAAGCSASDTAVVHIADYQFTGSIGAGDPSQTGRINRLAQTSVCPGPKAFPGMFVTTGARLYDAYNITNIRSVPVCATVGIASGCGVNIFTVAYSGSFNPADPSQNYLGDPGSSFPSSGFMEVTIPANSTIVLVVHEVNTGTGCANYMLTVDVPRDPAAITVSPTPPICAGNPVTLTAPVANTYSWNPGGATTQAINVTPATTTNYDVTLGYGNIGCTNNISTSVTVNPAATANAGPDDATCGLTYPAFAANTPVVGTGAWSQVSGPGSSTFTNGSSPTSGVTVTANGVYVFRWTVTAGAPCPGSAQDDVQINFAGTPSTADAGTDKTACVNPGSVSMTATAPTVGIGSWTQVAGPVTANIISPNLANTLITGLNTTGTYTFRWTVSNAPCNASFDDVDVVVNSNPATPTITGGGTFCPPGTTLAGPINPNFTYQWGRSYLAAPFAGLGTAQTQAVTASGNYQLTVTNQFGCSSSAITVVNVADYVFNGSLAAGDAQQTGRLNRFAAISTCAAPKTCPLTFTTTGARFYDAYTITNVRNVPVCATIGLNSGCGTAVFSAAYSGSFNPTSLCTNYLADPGSSPAASIFYEATIPANGTIVVVVHEVNPGQLCANYTLTVDVPRDPGAITATPGTTSCSGAPITLTAPVANTYSWTPGGATTQSVVQSTPGTFNYSVTLGYGNNGCTDTRSQSITITNPTVDAVLNQYFCNGSTATVNFVGGGPGTTYNWTNTNTAIGLAASGSGNLNFTATNSTAAPITGTITVTPVNGVCTGTPTTFTITVANQPNITSVTPGAVCAPGGVVNLAAAGNGTIYWYDALTGGSQVNTGPTYAPNVSATTTYYVESVVPSSPTSFLALPGQSNTFPGNVRGYWFTAPTNFVITSLSIPTTASSGSMNIAVVKFTGNVPPPIFSATTNAFTTVFQTTNNPSLGNVPCNIPVASGEVIGILGYRGGINSYAPGDYSTTIAGLPVQLQRLGMQFPLNTAAPPHDLWREFGATTSISRVEFEYAAGPTCTSSPRVPVTATVNPVPTATATPASQTVCSGPITSIVLTSSQPGTTYTWTRDNNVNVTGIPASGSGSTISGTLTNNTTVPQTVTFTITPTITATGCVGPTITATVTVNAVPTITCPGNITVNNDPGQCGAIVTYTPTVTGIPVPTLTYTFTGATTGSGSGSGSGSFFNKGTTNVSITATNICGAASCSFTVTVNDNEPPVVTAGTISSCYQTVVAAEAAALAATTATDNCPGVLIKTVSTVGTCSAVITVTVTDVAGNSASVTYNTRIDNTPPAVICPAPIVVCGPAAVPLPNIALVNATDNCPGTITITHQGDVSTPNPFAPYDITRTYRATDGCGNFTECTQTITVNPIPNVVATPASQTTCSGFSLNPIILTSNVANTVFSWTRDNIAATTGIPANGIGDVHGALTNTTNAPVTVTFTITPSYTNAGTTCTGTPITATVIVNPTPNVVATPSSQTICSGSAITTIVNSGNVAGTVFNWTRDNTGTVTGIAASGTGNISGSLTNTTTLPITVTFTITPSYTNAGTTCTGPSITATVVVNPIPNAVAAPAAQTICSGSGITTIVNSGNVIGTVFNWTRNNTGTVTGIAASGSGDISGTLTNNTNAPVTVTFTITPSFTNAGTTCTGTPVTATVVVNPIPNAVATPASQTICSGNAITTIVNSGNVAGTVYSWTRDNTAAVTGIAASGTGNISGTLTNTTNNQLFVTFTITPSYTNAGITCTGTPITATVLVNPTPNAVANPASQTICSGNPISSIILSGNVANTVFNWTRNNTATVTGIAASGSGSNISGTLTNTTNAPVTVTFTITPVANGCTGPSITATVVVNPTPNVVAAPTTQTICSGTAMTPITFTGNVAGTSFNWTRDNTTTVAGLPGSGSGTISGVLINVTTAPVTITFTITPVANGCAGTPVTATVTVNPTPTIVCPANIVVNAAPGTCGIDVLYPPVTVTGVPTPTVTYSIPSGSNFSVGVTTVTVTATNICGTATCTFTVTVNDVRVPVITTQPVSRAVCVGASASFSVVATNAASYQWQTGSGNLWGNIPGATSATYTIPATTLFMNNSNYRVLVTGPCGTVVTSNVVNLVVNPLPFVNLTTATTPALIPTRTATILSVVSPTGGSYAWLFNGSPITGAAGPTLGPLSVDNIGRYNLIYTDPNGCVTTSSDFLITGEASFNFWVYPNPNQGQFQIRFNNQNGEVAKVNIFNPLGQKVFSQQVTTGPTTYTRIDVNLGQPTAAGIYTVELLNGQNLRVGAKQVLITLQ